MNKLLASVVISLPLLLGGNSLFASAEQVNFYSDKTNYPLYPINSVQQFNDKSEVGIQYAQYYRRSFYRQGGYHGVHHHGVHNHGANHHHGHHRGHNYYQGHRRCWVSYDGYRHCRSW